MNNLLVLFVCISCLIIAIESANEDVTIIKKISKIIMRCIEKCEYKKDAKKCVAKCLGSKVEIKKCIKCFNQDTKRQKLVLDIKHYKN